MQSVKDPSSFVLFANSEHVKRHIGNTIYFSDVQKLFKTFVLDVVDMNNAIECAEQVQSTNIRSALLSDVSIKLTQYGELDRARKIANIVDQKYSQSLAFQAMSLHMADKEQFEPAIKETANIKDSMCLGSTFEKISMKMFKKGRVEDSIVLAKNNPFDGYRYSTLWCIQDEAKKCNDLEILTLVNRLIFQQ